MCVGAWSGRGVDGCAVGDAIAEKTSGVVDAIAEKRAYPGRDSWPDAVDEGRENEQWEGSGGEGKRKRRGDEGRGEEGRGNDEQ